MKKISWGSLLYFILLPIVISFLIQMMIPDVKGFYNDLEKPFRLPTIVFPIVWNTIFVLIGIAAYLIYKEKGYGKEIRIFYIQLFFNFTWTILFFGFHLLGISVIWIIMLFILVIINAICFYKVNKISGLLFIPYILWLIIASYLNIAIYFLN